ncbi:acetyltransferase [Demequina sp. NBRC 110052]|uniref:acetyltransferase n=1 Tax=Demequina sp. NBRC 110052 TaxID=1570341 RepID=UPI00117E2AA6|nr:acetyltransferase [Demequina sp. NBRC 110052]
MSEGENKGADIPVIPLKDAPGERVAWGRPAIVVYFWGLVEWLLVTNALQVSSRVRVAALRAFGAKIGSGVIYRPRTRVKFPWKLEIGDDCWIGEGVWIHNQDQVTIGHDVVISQETFITTGSHAHRRDMALVTRPVVIEPGAWITARCIVTGGVMVGRSSLMSPGSVARNSVEPGRVVAGNPARPIADRVDRGGAGHNGA